MKSKHAYLILTVLVLASLLLASCGKTTEAPAPVEEPETIPPSPEPVKSPISFGEEEPVATKHPELKPGYTAPVTAPPSATAAKPSGGKKKGWVWILVAVLILAVLGAGGWYVYNSYFKEKPGEPAIADSTAYEQEMDTTAEFTETVVEESSPAVQENVAERPKTEPEKPVTIPKKTEAQKEKPKTSEKPTATKQTTTPKTTQPSNNEPIKISQPKNNGGIAIQPAEPSASDKESKVLMQVGESGKPKYKGPKNPVKFVVKKTTMITRITTDHYNDGNGTATVGSIIIKDNSGNVVGSYQASGRAGSTGIPNMKWVATPNLKLEPGTYNITVSDPSTWSKNLLGNAFIVIEGYQL